MAEMNKEQNQEEDSTEKSNGELRRDNKEIERGENEVPQENEQTQQEARAKRKKENGTQIGSRKYENSVHLTHTDYPLRNTKHPNPATLLPLMATGGAACERRGTMRAQVAKGRPRALSGFAECAPERSASTVGRNL